MELDSHSTKSPSRITGTSRLGFIASSPGSSTTCSKCRSSSAQVHSTLRTLIDEVRPSTRSVIELPLLALYLLHVAIDDGHHHRRLAGAEVVGPGLDHGFADFHVPAGVAVRRAHVLDAAFPRGWRAALVQQLGERDVLVDDPLSAAEGFSGGSRRQQRCHRDDDREFHRAMLHLRPVQWFPHHCLSQGTPSPPPSIFTPGQFSRKNSASSQEVIWEQ